MPVPKLMPSSGSVPTSRHHSMNSLVPNWFVSIEFQARSSTVGPLRLRADAVEPVVAGDEVAARIADDRHAEFLDLAHDVRAEALRVGQRRAGLVDAGVDRAAEMLEERAEQTPIEIGAIARATDGDARRSARACA